MPPPQNPVADRIAAIMFAEQQRRYNAGFTLDQYPASYSDLVYCALALMDERFGDARSTVLRLMQERAALRDMVLRSTQFGSQDWRDEVNKLLDARDSSETRLPERCDDR